MELYGLKPAVARTFSKLPLPVVRAKPQVIKAIQKVLLTHPLNQFTGTAVPMREYQIPLSSAPERAGGSSLLADLLSAQEKGSGSAFKLMDREPLPLLSLKDIGTVKSGYARLEGFTAGLSVLVNGQLRWISDNGGSVYVDAGRIVVYSQNGTLMASGYVKRGHVYQVLDLALTKPVERWDFEGPHEEFQFQLNRMSQAPGVYIQVDRLKNSSYVHANGIWYQADNNGTVQVGPLEPGTYALIVTDRWGEAYGWYEQAVPGDKLLGGYNFATGYGYYGWYSGKGFEVRKAFIEAFDQFLSLDTGLISKLKQTLATEQIVMADGWLGRKSPTVQSDLTLLDDQGLLGRIKSVLYDSFLADDRGWKHLTPFLTDTVLVDELGTMFNTRVRVYETITLRDSSNKPASWHLLDVVLLDELATQARTKQTVYDWLFTADTGSSTYRSFRKPDTILIDEQGYSRKLSKHGLDILTLQDIRAQTLISLAADDLLTFTDSGERRIASIRVRDAMYLLDSFTVRNASYRADDFAELYEHAVNRFPNRSRVPDTFFLKDRLVLGLLGDTPHYPAPFFPGQVYLIGGGLYPDELPEGGVKVPPSQDFVSYLTRSTSDSFKLLDSIPDSEQRPGPDTPQLTERAMLQRAYRRADPVTVRDGHILTRQKFAADVFGMDSVASLPEAVSFAPSGLTLTRIAAHQFRPELRLTKAGDTTYAAYLRQDGGLYVAKSHPDGRWGGIQAQLVAPTPGSTARSVGVAVGVGDTVFVCAVWDNTVRVYRQQGESWVLHQQASSVTDAQLASTSRYAPRKGQVLLATTSPSEPKVLRWQSIQGESLSGVQVFIHQVRLDQVAVQGGQVHWIVADTENLLTRTAFASVNSSVELTDTRPVRFAPIGVRQEAAVLYAHLTDTLSVQLLASKAELTGGLEQLFPHDSQPVQLQLRSGRLVKAMQDHAMQEDHPVSLEVRSLRFDRAVYRPTPQDAQPVRFALTGMSLTPSTLNEETEDALQTRFALQGGSYVRT